MSNRSGSSIPEDERKTKRVQTRVREEVNNRLLDRSNKIARSASDVLRESIERSWWAILSETSISETVKPKVDNGKVDLVATVQYNNQAALYKVTFPEMKKFIYYEESHPAFSEAFQKRRPSLDGDVALVSLEEVPVACSDGLAIDGKSFDVKHLELKSRDDIYGFIAACEDGKGVHLLRLVSDLRMLISGAYEVYGVTYSMQALAVRWLRWRITEGWDRSFGSRLCKDLDHAFDESVRTMAASVCEMWDRQYADRIAALEST